MLTGKSPKKLHAVELEQLLERHDYLWDNWALGFRRVRNISQETTEQYLSSTPDIVTFEELEDHGCFRLDLSPSERHASYNWLTQRLKSGKAT